MGGAPPPETEFPGAPQADGGDGCTSERPGLTLPRASKWSRRRTLRYVQFIAVKNEDESGVGPLPLYSCFSKWCFAVLVPSPFHINFKITLSISTEREVCRS